MTPTEPKSSPSDPILYAIMFCTKFALRTVCVIAPSLAVMFGIIAVSLETASQTQAASVAWGLTLLTLFVLIVAYNVQRRIRLND